MITVLLLCTSTLIQYNQTCCHRYNLPYLVCSFCWRKSGVLCLHCSTSMWHHWLVVVACSLCKSHNCSAMNENDPPYSWTNYSTCCGLNVNSKFCSLTCILHRIMYVKTTVCLACGYNKQSQQHSINIFTSIQHKFVTNFCTYWYQTQALVIKCSPRLNFKHSYSHTH